MCWEIAIFDGRTVGEFLKFYGTSFLVSWDVDF